MGRAHSHGVIGQKNIVAYVNSSNTHRGHSCRQHTSTRDAFTAITQPPEALSEPLHIYRGCFQNSIHPRQKWCSQHIPTGSLSRPPQTMGDTTAASTFLETLPQQYTSTGNPVTAKPSSRLYFIRTACTSQVSQRPDTNRRLCCSHPYQHPCVYPIGNTVLGVLHTPQTELSQLLNKLPLTYDTHTMASSHS